MINNYYEFIIEFANVLVKYFKKAELMKKSLISVFFVFLLFLSCDLTGGDQNDITSDESVKSDIEWIDANKFNYSSGDNSSDIKSNFSVPLKGKFGSTLKWLTDSKLLLINPLNGEIKITRPLDNDIIVYIEVAVTKDSSKDEKILKIVIKKYSNEECVNLDKLLINADKFTYSGSDNSRDVKGSFKIPLAGQYETVFDWGFSSELIEINKSTGDVYIIKQPGVDTNAVFILTIKKGDYSQTKEILIILKTTTTTTTTSTIQSASTTTTTTTTLLPTNTISAIINPGLENAITFNPINASVSKSELLTISVETGYESYEWYIDGVKQAFATTDTININTETMFAKQYELMLIIKKNGIGTSGRCYFRINN